MKLPISGRSIAVPAQVPRGSSGVIDRKFRPSRLFGAGSRARTSIRSRGRVVQGAHRTYLIRQPGGRGTIFWRRQLGVRAIPWYHLVPSVDLDHRLRFVDTVTRTVLETYSGHFLRRFDRAIRTAR